jgi:8-oxo-dGTP pyrophosphatase MutT (NUDIX family)
METLLVRARQHPNDWVIPKGHIEADEEPHECARREIREEGAVEAEPVAFVGQDTFTTQDGKDVNVAFFLMRYVRDVVPAEARDRCWCTFADALTLIRFGGAREIIQSAEGCLKRRLSPKGGLP